MNTAVLKHCCHNYIKFPVLLRNHNTKQNVHFLITHDVCSLNSLQNLC